MIYVSMCICQFVLAAFASGMLQELSHLNTVLVATEHPHSFVFRTHQVMKAGSRNFT